MLCLNLIFTQNFLDRMSRKVTYSKYYYLFCPDHCISLEIHLNYKGQLQITEHIFCHCKERYAKGLINGISFSENRTDASRGKNCQ